LGSDQAELLKFKQMCPKYRCFLALTHYFPRQNFSNLHWSKSKEELPLVAPMSDVLHAARNAMPVTQAIPPSTP